MMHWLPSSVAGRHQHAQPLHIQPATPKWRNGIPCASCSPNNLVNQKVATGILAKYGYRADVAADGVEVLAALDRQILDLILMDINMPTMDGLTATRSIRSSLPQPKQPYIIALTANGMHEDQARCLSAGMNSYISKPKIR